MTYSEKLKDPRWQDFRSRVFIHYGMRCTTCGEDKPYTDKHHIHHKRYLPGHEPWEYSMDDVTVICRECHDEIHACETQWRDLIRSLPSWVVFEFSQLADEFSIIKDPGDQKLAAARAKNTVRGIRHKVADSWIMNAFRRDEE